MNKPNEMHKEGEKKYSEGILARLLQVGDSTVRSVRHELDVLVQRALNRGQRIKFRERHTGKSEARQGFQGEKMRETHRLDFGFPRDPLLAPFGEFLLRHLHVDRVLDRVDVDLLLT